ncbi:MAG TPA: histidine kinase [Thermoanaerobaculia bacterium]|jgi:signal transduction histidine kinase|nr:histidine kinase [Thermoanaerobaculia bacterium]
MTSPPQQKFSLSAREIALIFAFWTFLATLSAVNRLLDPRGLGFRPMSPAGPITLAYIEAWTWAAFTPFILWLSSWSSARARSFWLRVPLLLLIGIGVAILMYMLIDVARFIVIDQPVRRGRASAFAPLSGIGRFRFLNQLVVYLAVLAAGFAREYFLRDQQRQRQAAQLQAQLAEARLDALRMQINPHFLFNTLHAVSALVERDPSGVRRMIARLSELLRYTIESHATDEVPLREELAFLRRYIEIMEIRFQGRLHVGTSIAEDTQEALVPNLILQPIVENALEHGVNRASGEGRISINARRDGDRLVLTVRDNGPGLDASNESGVGLANTRARLEQLYGARASLTLAAAEGGGVVAEITLPYHEHA